MPTVGITGGRPPCTCDHRAVVLLCPHLARRWLVLESRSAWLVVNTQVKECSWETHSLSQTSKIYGRILSHVLSLQPCLENCVKLFIQTLLLTTEIEYTVLVMQIWWNIGQRTAWLETAGVLLPTCTQDGSHWAGCIAYYYPDDRSHHHTLVYLHWTTVWEGSYLFSYVSYVTFLLIDYVCIVKHRHVVEICTRFSSVETSAIELKLWHNVQNGLNSHCNISFSDLT